MRPPRRRTLAALVAALLLPSPAGAGDAWLLPTRSTVPPGVEVGVDLRVLGVGPLADDAVREGRVRVGGRTEALPAWGAGPRGARFRVPLRQPGIATLALAVGPHDVALDSAAAEARLRATGAPDSVRRAFLAGRPRAWRERRTVHAKTFVRVASPLRPVPDDDVSWSIPVGAPLELVPERDPTTLRAGDTLVVRVLRGGRPVYAFPVALAREEGRGETLHRTATWGRVALPLPRGGRWLVRAAELRRAADQEWTGEVATLTVLAR